MSLKIEIERILLNKGRNSMEEVGKEMKNFEGYF